MNEYKDSLPIIIHPSVEKRIVGHYSATMKNPRDCPTAVAYYISVYGIARYQGNSSAYATNTFMAKRYFCGTDKIKRIKSVLHKLGLITYRKSFSKEMKGVVTYVTIVHIWKRDSVISLAVAIQDKDKKDYLIKNYSERVICTGEDIGVEEIFIDINGCDDLSTFATDIYFNEDEMLCTTASINGGSEIEHIFSTDDAPRMTRKVYDYVVN